ncbi:MAG: glycosyltransferase family 4 protein [Alphaproteobacteria bacterium]|nr:glycosyltransferase family 4 protein [Alphaproteobacteria bacterium]MCB9974979.1 glycosyltransferase family 4 protein [Rhodospirillales bacterium]
MAQQSILYVINHPDWFWSHRLPLAAGARDAGYRVLVAMPGGAGDEKLSEHGFTGLDLPEVAGAGGVFKTVFALRRLIAQHRPGIVHAITLKYAFMTGLAARLTGVQVVHTVAGLGYLFSAEGIKPKILRTLIGPFLKLALNGKSIRVIFQNPDDLDLLVKRGFVRRERTALIRGSGVDTHVFKPREHAGEADPPVVLMPTRLVRDKGVAVFVEAARILKAEGMRARFQIAGGLSAGNPLAMTEAEMKALCADGAVEWLGPIKDMPGLFSTVCLVAYPSYYREGVPKVLLEAAAMGKAIVTTDHPGCREAVSHGVNGLLFPVRDAKACADSIRTLLDDPARRAAMGRAGRDLALREFDVKHVVAETLKVYSGLRG